MDIGKDYIEKLVKEKRQVKVSVKGNRFYSCIIKGFSEIGILILDKYGMELYFDFSEILRIIPTKDNGNSEGGK